MRILIKNGHIVTAVDSYIADVLVDGETVTMIGKNLARVIGEVDKTIDATNKLIIPGGVDPHTHMDLPFGGTSSSDDFETGTRAAAFGGTTTIIDFAVQYRGQALNEALDVWFAKAEGKATTDYGFHLIVTELPDERTNDCRN
jgi:dihydropyrimidinase